MLHNRINEITAVIENRGDGRGKKMKNRDLGLHYCQDGAEEQNNFCFRTHAEHDSHDTPQSPAICRSSISADIFKMLVSQRSRGDVSTHCLSNHLSPVFLPPSRTLSLSPSHGTWHTKLSQSRTPSFTPLVPDCLTNDLTEWQHLPSLFFLPN